MRINLELFGRKLLMEVSGLDHIYIQTSGHEFFYSRQWWFEGPNGKDRHWRFSATTSPKQGDQKTSQELPLP